MAFKSNIAATKIQKKAKFEKRLLFSVSAASWLFLMVPANNKHMRTHPCKKPRSLDFIAQRSKCECRKI